MARKFPAAGRGIVASSTATDSRGGFLRHQGYPLVGVGIGLAFLAGGLLFIVLGARQVAESLSFSFGTQETVGHVSAWHNTTSSKGTKLWHPVVRYVVDGREFTVTGKVGGAVQDYALGDAVRVLYRPAQPEQAQLNEFSERWFGAVVAGVVGTLCAGMGSVLAWRSFREWRRPVLIV